MSDIFKSFDDDKIKDLKNNEELNKLKEQYKDKSDEEVYQEAKIIGKQLKEKFGEEEFSKKLKDLKKIEPFLTKDQREKLNKIIESLD